jgi:hypothetical protein
MVSRLKTIVSFFLKLPFQWFNNLLIFLSHKAGGKFQYLKVNISCSLIIQVLIVSNFPLLSVDFALSHFALVHCRRRNIPSYACISLILEMTSIKEPIFVPFQRCRPSSAIAIAALASGSRFLPPISTLPFVKRHHNGCAGAREPIFVPLFNAAVCQAPSQ